MRNVCVYSFRAYYITKNRNVLIEFHIHWSQKHCCITSIRSHSNARSISINFHTKLLCLIVCLSVCILCLFSFMMHFWGKVCSIKTTISHEIIQAPAVYAWWETIENAEVVDRDMYVCVCVCVTSINVSNNAVQNSIIMAI